MHFDPKYNAVDFVFKVRKFSKCVAKPVIILFTNGLNRLFTSQVVQTYVDLEAIQRTVLLYGRKMWFYHALYFYWFNALCVAENIAFNKTTWQQHFDPRFKWGADRAVDGKYSDLSANGGQCTITTFGKNKTYLPWGTKFFFQWQCSLVGLWFRKI